MEVQLRTSSMHSDAEYGAPGRSGGCLFQHCLLLLCPSRPPAACRELPASHPFPAPLPPHQTTLLLAGKAAHWAYKEAPPGAGPPPPSLPRDGGLAAASSASSSSSDSDDGADVGYQPGHPMLHIGPGACGLHPEPS